LKSISEKPGVKTSLLYGMKVVSFCHYLQGPAAMLYLADMGAEVIKIEPPNGAFERHWGHAILADAGFSSNEVTELIRDQVVFEPEGVS
jgi:crotonobetainyl-CoA:carnitine CoA-transferase CaiB-like acyl-CoA transferase